MSPAAILGAAAVCAVLWAILPSRNRAGPATHVHHGHGGGWLVAGLLVAGGIVAAKTGGGGKVAAAAAAHPPPPQVLRVNTTVIRYVPAPAGHLLSGWLLFGAICVAACAGVAVVYLVVRFIGGLAS